MNTTLKPPVSPQNSSVPNQLNKPMHPQGTSTFNQPSGHMSQNPYPNLNVAHNHPNVQQNHFSLNVPNAASHFNMGAIPASNHPVASLSQSAAGQQIFNQPKSATYSSSYQPNLGHPPNQNTIPPVCQSLPASTQIQSQQPQSNSPSQKTVGSPTTPASTPDAPLAEKPQSNGTPEPKTPTKSEGQSNHVTPPSPVPSQITQASTQQTEKFPEKAKAPIPEQKPPPQESTKPVDPPTPTKASPSTNNEVDPLSTEDVKEVTNTTSVRENKQTDKVEESSVLPMETDPLSIEKEESSIDSSTAEQTVEREENPHTSASAKKEEESRENSTDDKNTNENVQETESNVQQATNKPADSETPVKQTTQRTAKKQKTPKTENVKPAKAEPKTPIQKSPGTGKIKRQRTRTQHYQSPLPEIEIVTKMTSSTPRSKSNDDKLILFYKNEFLAVRNAEGGFYLCQAVQNIYKSSAKIKIRWLSQDKNDKTGEIYTPDFYDLTDFDCILTNLDLERVDKGQYRLVKAEKERTDSILKRCLAVEKGEITNPSVSEEHPDGLDLSLYKDEEQLKKRKGTKRKARSVSRKKEPAIKKSPEASKVQKVEVTQTKKAASSVVKKTIQKKSPIEVKKPVVTSRSPKSKRKSDSKTSPVVDQKKAKVLAKIGRKTAIPASTSRSQPPAKSVKPAKAIPTTSKSTVKPPVVPIKTSTSTRKTKRSTRK